MNHEFSWQTEFSLVLCQQHLHRILTTSEDFSCEDFLGGVPHQCHGHAKRILEEWVVDFRLWRVTIRVNVKRVFKILNTFKKQRFALSWSEILNKLPNTPSFLFTLVCCRFNQNNRVPTHDITIVRKNDHLRKYLKLYLTNIFWHLIFLLSYDEMWESSLICS